MRSQSTAGRKAEARRVNRMARRIRTMRSQSTAGRKAEARRVDRMAGDR